MCKTLKVSASGFYGWLDRPVCQRQKANVALTAQIREAFVASDETYGMPRICAELMDSGIVASRRRSFCIPPGQLLHPPCGSSHKHLLVEGVAMTG